MKYDHGTYSQRVDEILCAAGAKAEIYGEVTHEGETYPLRGYELLRENVPLVYLSTGMHGDEPAGPEGLLYLLENGLLERELSFCICPMINPTGFELGTRENAIGRDLNRDYFFLRNSEVSSHVKWLEEKMRERVPDVFISLHEDWESEGFYFYEINLGEDDPERYEYMVECITAVMPLEAGVLIDDHEVRSTGWIYHRAEADMEKNWPEAIYMAKQGCPLSFTFETPSAKDKKHRVAAQATAVNSLLDYLYGA